MCQVLFYKFRLNQPILRIYLAHWFRVLDPLIKYIFNYFIPLDWSILNWNCPMAIISFRTFCFPWFKCLLNGSDFLARNMFTNSLILIFVIMERFWICNWISFIHLIWLDWQVKTTTISLIFPSFKFYLNWLNFCWIWWMAASSQLTNVIINFPPFN